MTVSMSVSSFYCHVLVSPYFFTRGIGDILQQLSVSEDETHTHTSINIYIYKCTHIYIYTHISTHTYLFICIYIYIHTHLYACIYICTPTFYTSTNIYTLVCIYIAIHKVDIYTCWYIYVHTHFYIYTFRNVLLVWLFSYWQIFEKFLSIRERHQVQSPEMGGVDESVESALFTAIKLFSWVDMHSFSPFLHQCSVCNIFHWSFENKYWQSNIVPVCRRAATKV